jgi:hypothetical protein
LSYPALRLGLAAAATTLVFGKSAILLETTPAQIEEPDPVEV